jgi:hypothetical protein
LLVMVQKRNGDWRGNESEKEEEHWLAAPPL